MNHPSVKQLEAAYNDLAEQQAALRKEHNDLAEEHARLTTFLARANARTPSLDRVVAEKDLETIIREGERIRQEQQRLADEMTRIMRDLAPARTALREAKQTLARIDALRGDESDVMRLGWPQLRQAQKQLKTLVSQLEA